MHEFQYKWNKATDHAIVSFEFQMSVNAPPGWIALFTITIRAISKGYALLYGQQTYRI